MEKPASPELPSSMNFKPGESGRISISGLKSRGWTDKTVREFLGMADWTTDNPHYKNAAPMLLYDTHRVEQAEQDPWYQRRKRGGKNSRCPIPAEDVNSTGAFRSIPPVPLDTQRTAFEQREAVAQVQNALGVPRKQIAQELGVSEATVRRYLRTPEQRAQSAAKARRQLHAAETARQTAAQRHELERVERAQRHQVRLSVRALYDTGLTADESAGILGITPFQAGKFIMESGVRQRAIRWKNIPQEEMERRQRAADHKRKRKQRRDNRQQAAGKKAK